MRFEELLELAARPVPVRTMLIRRALRRWPVGSLEARLWAGAVNRPGYTLCAWYAAREARALGYPAVSVVELGVAGGNGLVRLCELGQEIEKELGIRVEITGFDTAAGLPPSEDVRDAPYFWKAGLFEMNREALERRIAGRAQLVVGDVAETVASWTPRADAPLGAVMFDLDLYSSTTRAMALLEKAQVLPRIYCYFDDIDSGPECALTERIGEREAIREFNAAPERAKEQDHLSPACIFDGRVTEPWHRKVYLYHRLRHPEYNQYVSIRAAQEDRKFRLARR